MARELFFCVGWNFGLVEVGHVVEVLGIDVLVVHRQNAAFSAIGAGEREEVDAIVVVTRLQLLLLPAL
jgi:hypothetical protein